MDGLEMRYEGIAAQVEHAKISDQQAEGKNRHLNFNILVEEEAGAIFARYFS